MKILLLVPLLLLLSFSAQAEELPEPRHIPTPLLLDVYGQQFLAYTRDQYLDLLELDIRFHYSAERERILRENLDEAVTAISALEADINALVLRAEEFERLYGEAEESLATAITQLEQWESGDLCECEKQFPTFWFSMAVSSTLFAVLLLVTR